jgi:hydrogenase maturation protease
MKLKDKLLEFWGDKLDRKIIVMGLGSDIRGDEAAPLEIIDRLEEENLNSVYLIRAETRPENFTENIRRFNPTHMLILHAGSWGGEPGDTLFVPLEENDESSLHESPLTSLIHYLKPILDVKVRLLYIEPKISRFGEITPELEEAVKRISVSIINSLKERPNPKK